MELKQFEQEYEQLYQKGLTYIVKEVRKELAKPENSHVLYFIMAMGVITHGDGTKNAILMDLDDGRETEEIFPTVSAFLASWNRNFKFTGEGIKVYRNKIVTRW